jgi:dynein heavy chain 1
LGDIFPGVNSSTTDVNDLVEMLQVICSERLLDCGDVWRTKILQLYQLLHIHHGLIMVGPSGSGKSTAWQVLFEALNRMEDVEGVFHVIDPKAITKETLYGNLDPVTREWTDGIFTHTLRKIIQNIRGESTKRHWIIFDGDVDPEWVENLNRCVLNLFSVTSRF